jgi:hypothetical protein
LIERIERGVGPGTVASVRCRQLKNGLAIVNPIEIAVLTEDERRGVRLPGPQGTRRGWFSSTPRREFAARSAYRMCPNCRCHPTR